MSIFDEQDIVEESSYVLCMFMFCSRMFLALTRICQYLDPIPSANLTLGLLVEILVTILLFAFIMLSFYHNFKYRNYLTNVPYLNNKLLFMIFIPTGMFTVLYKSISTFAYVGVGSNVGQNLGNLSVTLILFLIMAVYIADINMYRDYGEVWKINFFNVLTILFTYLFLISDSSMILSREQINIFHRQLNSSFSIHMRNYSTKLIKMTEILNIFYFKFGILVELISVILLMDPLRRHFTFLKEYKPKPIIISNNFDRKNRISDVSLVSVIICCVTTLCILTLIISNFYFSTIPIEIHILIIILYLFYTLNSYFILSYVRSLPRKRPKNKLFYFFLLLGLFGQTIEAFSSIFYVYYSSKVSYPSSLVIIIQYSTQLIQCYLQSVLTFIALEKGFKDIHHDTIFSFLYDVRPLITLNIGFFIANLCGVHIRPVSSEKVKSLSFRDSCSILVFSPCFDMSYPSNISIIEGETATIDCVIKNVDFSRTSISWWKDGDMGELTLGKMIINNRYSLSQLTLNHWSLVISNTTEHDSGAYICQINLKMVTERIFHLTIKKKFHTITQNDDSLRQLPKSKHIIPIFVEIKGPSSVNTDDPFHLKCVINPIPEYTMGFSAIEWWLNNKRIQSTSNPGKSIQITMEWKANDTMESFIYVEKAELEHEGIWTCSFDSISKIPLWEKDSSFEIKKSLKVNIQSVHSKEHVEKLIKNKSYQTKHSFSIQLVSAVSIYTVLKNN